MVSACLPCHGQGVFWTVCLLAVRAQKQFLGCECVTLFAFSALFWVVAFAEVSGWFLAVEGLEHCCLSPLLYLQSHSSQRQFFTAELCTAGVSLRQLQVAELPSASEPCAMSWKNSRFSFSILLTSAI